MKLYSGGKWFALCGDVWDINAGSVACRQLGYPVAKNVSGSGEGLVAKEKLWTAVSCNGNESSLNRCHKQSLSKCGQKASVNCEPGQ